MNTEMNTDTEQTTSGGMRWPQVLLIVLVTILLTIGGTWWALKTYLFASEFKPVELSVKEEQVLQTKLRALGYQTGGRSMGQEREPVGELNEEGFLKPEPYSEVGAKREVSFNERELNALLAKNTDLAKKLAIDLSDDLVSARLLVPMDADFPVLGGKTLRFNAGVEMAYLQGKPVIVLKGVSIMGVPIPNAWLGGLKNIDLVSEFGNRDGFWKSFSEGVDNIRVENGKITVKLKE